MKKPQPRTYDAIVASSQPSTPPPGFEALARDMGIWTTTLTCLDMTSVGLAHLVDTVCAVDPHASIAVKLTEGEKVYYGGVDGCLMAVFRHAAARTRS